MKYVRAKIGTHAVTEILVLKGSTKLGGRIEWVEGPDFMVKYGVRHRGIVDHVNEDGLIFVNRM